MFHRQLAETRAADPALCLVFEEVGTDSEPWWLYDLYHRDISVFLCLILSLTFTEGWELSPRNANTALSSFDWKKAS